MSVLRAIAKPEHLLILIWAQVLAGLVWSDPMLEAAGAVLLAVFVVASLPRLRRQTLILCGLLAMAAAALAIAFDAWDAVPRAIGGATVFAAFFGTIMVLRATADRRPETANARRLFDRLDTAQQSGVFLVASHAIGALLVVGVMAILAPIRGAEAPDESRREAAEVCQRGMCLASLWSPFWVAMAVASQHLPTVPLWQVMALGLPMAAAGLALAHLMYARNVVWGDLWRAVLALRPVGAPVAICAAVITLLSGLTHLSTLQSVAAATPVICAAALLSQGRREFTSAFVAAYRGLGGVADEVVLMTVALALGRVLEAVLAEHGVTGWIAGLGLAPAWLIAITVVAMTLTSLIGIHQVVSMTVVLVLFAPLSAGLGDLILMESALIGWGFASMVGISAVSVASASTMFRVPMERLAFGPNLKFVAVYGVGAILILAVVNRLVFAA